MIDKYLYEQPDADKENLCKEDIPDMMDDDLDPVYPGNKYFKKRINPLTALEGLMSLYFFGGLGLAFYFGDFALLPFHLLLSLGFLLVFYYSVQHTRNA